jgi:hypothetical protein
MAGASVDTAAPTSSCPDNIQAEAPVAMISALMTGLFKMTLLKNGLIIKNIRSIRRNLTAQTKFYSNFYSPIFKVQGLGSI